MHAEVIDLDKDFRRAMSEQLVEESIAFVLFDFAAFTATQHEAPETIDEWLLRIIEAQSDLNLDGMHGFIRA